MLSSLVVNILGGLIVVLFGGWLIWRKREKLILSYTITESDFFPTENGQGKYYAIKIENEGGKPIKNIEADISVSDAEINKVTSHDRIPSMEKTENRIKFVVKDLNQKEDINFIITTSKASETSKPLSIKIRGEGANAKEKTTVKSSLWGTAIIFGLIGVLGGLIGSDYLAGSIGDSPNQPTQLETIFSILNKSELPHVFHQIVKTREDNISYEGTAFFLTSSYLRDPENRAKYITALKNLASVENLASNSKGIIYYLIYKIDKNGNNVGEANEYLVVPQKVTFRFEANNKASQIFSSKNRAQLFNLCFQRFMTRLKFIAAAAISTFISSPITPFKKFLFIR